MAIGNIGSAVVFHTSDSRVVNYQSMSTTETGRWAKHTVINGKPKQQFLGPELGEVTFTIKLSAELGAKPRKTYDNLHRLLKEGTPVNVVIGNKRIGDGMYVVTSLSGSTGIVLNRGEIISMTIDVTLQEYN